MTRKPWGRARGLVAVHGLRSPDGEPLAPPADPLDDAPEMVPFVTGEELEQRMAEAVALLPPGSVMAWEGPWRPTSLRQEMKRRRLEGPRPKR